MEVSSIMTEEKRQNIEVGNTTDVGFKLKQCSYENTLKDIDAQKLIQKQRDKRLQSVQTAKCFLIDRLNKQITSLLREIKEKDSMIQQLRNKIEFDKFQEKTEENKLDAVIAEIEVMRSTIKELWCEVKKNSLSDTKNITLNISQIRNLQISTEE